MSNTFNNGVSFSDDAERVAAPPPQSTGINTEINPNTTSKISQDLRAANDCTVLSKSAKAWDIDGDGELDEAELALREMDKARKGDLSKDQMYKLMSDNLKSQKELFKVKKVLGGLVGFTVLLACCNLGTSLTAAFLAKDTKSVDGSLVDSKTKRLLGTGSVSSEILIDEELNEEYRRRRLKNCNLFSHTMGNGTNACTDTNLMVVSAEAAQKIMDTCNDGAAVHITKQFADSSHTNYPVCNHPELSTHSMSFNFGQHQGYGTMRVTKDGIANAHTFLPSGTDPTVYEITGYASGLGMMCDNTADCESGLECSNQACAKLTAMAESVKDNGNGTTNPDKVPVIVVLREDKITDVAKTCNALSSANGGDGHVKNTFTKAILGCAFDMPARAINALSKNPQVDYVELDQVNYIEPDKSNSDDPYKVNSAELVKVNSAEQEKANYADPEMVNSAELDQDVEAFQTETDPYLWGLDRIDQFNLPLNRAPYEQRDASGVRVYALDTGVHGAHPKLSLSNDNDCHFSAYDGLDALVDDGPGHGTHVAGKICGDTFGVAKNCDLCAVKALMDNGSGTVDAVLAAIEHVIGDCPYGKATCVAHLSSNSRVSQTMNNAVARAVVAGIVMVVPAGNESRDACDSSPSSETKAITVGATDSADTKSSVSNYGTCVDVYAPGSSITSSIPPNTSTARSGSSMASAHVAGIAAAIRAADPSLTPAQVKDKILADARITGDLDRLGQPIRVANFIGGTISPTPVPTHIPTPALKPCPANQFRLTVDILTDNSPKETTWTLTSSCDDSKKWSLSGGPYSSASASETTPCLETDAKYTFTIKDLSGDGICCSNGEGSYSVSKDGVVQVKGGSFTSGDSHSFGTCP